VKKTRNAALIAADRQHVSQRVAEIVERAMGTVQWVFRKTGTRDDGLRNELC